MKIYYIAVSSWDGRAYTFDYNEFFFSEQERDATYEKLLHNANFDVCKGEESMPEVFDTAAFQKGVQEGRRLEREDVLKDAFVDNCVVHDGRIELEGDPLPSLDPILLLPYPQFKPGDKVKIIIAKEG